MQWPFYFSIINEGDFVLVYETDLLGRSFLSCVLEMYLFSKLSALFFRLLIVIQIIVLQELHRQMPEWLCSVLFIKNKPCEGGKKWEKEWKGRTEMRLKRGESTMKWALINIVIVQRWVAESWRWLIDTEHCLTLKTERMLKGLWENMTEEFFVQYFSCGTQDSRGSCIEIRAVRSLFVVNVKPWGNYYILLNNLYWKPLQWPNLSTEERINNWFKVHVSNKLCLLHYITWLFQAW